MTDSSKLVEVIACELADITGREAGDFSSATPLIGSGAEVRSRELVELLLALEEYAAENLGVNFDWSGDSAMSEARSIFRTVGTLAEHIGGLEVTE